MVGLEVKHIDGTQRIIEIEQSKGRKERNVMLWPDTLDLLRQWWKARPSRYDAEAPISERWLFPGNHYGKPMNTRQSAGRREDGDRPDKRWVFRKKSAEFAGPGQQGTRVQPGGRCKMRFEF